MNFQVKCNSCNGNVVLSHSALFTKKMDNGLVVTYWVCPHCKSVHNVQLDNKESLLILEKIKKQIRLISVKRKKGRVIQSTIREEYIALDKSLTEIRRILRKENPNIEVEEDGYGTM